MLRPLNSVPRSRFVHMQWAVLLFVVLIWRLPSLFDPPWVNDEGTYFAVAQAMAHGYRLYVDVWENKPPGIYLLYGSVYHLAGDSLLLVRLLATAAVVVIVWVTYRLAAHFAGQAAAPFAALLTGLLFGVPFLEGTTANAEVFLACLTALGVYLALVRRQPALAGLMMGCAITFKVVAVFDAAALGLWLLLYDAPYRDLKTLPVWAAGSAVGTSTAVERAAGSSTGDGAAGRQVEKHRAFAMIPYSLTLGGVLAVLVLTAWAGGILHGMVQDAWLYDLGYVGHANGGGIPWLLLLKAVGLGALTLWLVRRPFPVLWTGYAIAGALVSGRFFGHYALQAVVPSVLALSLLLRSGPERAQYWFRILPVVFLAAAALSGVIGWSAARLTHDDILWRRLQWYPNFVRYALHLESSTAYANEVDDHVTLNQDIASALRRLPLGKTLVWGNRPWIYVLSHRLPATPYTSSMRNPEVPGETATLRRAVREERPCAVVVIVPPAPPLGSASEALLRYHLVRQWPGARLYVRPAISR